MKILIANRFSSDILDTFHLKSIGVAEYDSFPQGLPFPDLGFLDLRIFWPFLFFPIVALCFTTSGSFGSVLALSVGTNDLKRGAGGKSCEEVRVREQLLGGERTEWISRKASPTCLESHFELCAKLLTENLEAQAENIAKCCIQVHNPI